jgi:hypothetical protein
MSYTSWILHDPRALHGMGRHVDHDPASRGFEYQRKDAPQVDRVWAHSTPVLDQGQRSSCVGNSGAQLLNSDLFKPFRVKQDKTWFTETDALNFYSLATHDDGFGESNYYPPNDQGSSGLGLCKALQGLGYIDRYEHCFDMPTTLSALQTQPLCVGTLWTNAMFTPDAKGYVHPGDLSDQSNIAGGHEYLLRGVLYSTNTLVFLNSWGQNWNAPLKGSFFMTIPEFQTLMTQQGDAVVPHVIGTP